MTERCTARESNDASVIRGSDTGERAEAHGRYEVECVGADGSVKWRDVIENVVAVVGKNLALDVFLGGSAYTVTGPFLGLISATSFTGVSASDTMATHSGWLESGGGNAPTYAGARKTVVWAAAAAGAKSMSTPLAFSITGAGTVKGLFLAYGGSASATKDDPGGTLWSAGTFSTGDKLVAVNDTLNVNYTTSL